MWFPLQKSSNEFINYIVCMLIEFIGALTFHNHIHETFSAFYQKMHNSFYTWIDLHFCHKDLFSLVFYWFSFCRFFFSWSSMQGAIITPSLPISSLHSVLSNSLDFSLVCPIVVSCAFPFPNFDVSSAISIITF